MQRGHNPLPRPHPLPFGSSIPKLWIPHCVNLRLTEAECENDVVAEPVVRSVERQLDGELLTASDNQLSWPVRLERRRHPGTQILAGESRPSCVAAAAAAADPRLARRFGRGTLLSHVGGGTRQRTSGSRSSDRITPGSQRCNE